MSELAAIQVQISRYTDAINRRDWGVFPEIYAADAHWEAVGEGISFDGLAAITEGLSGLAGAMSYLVQSNAPAVIEVAGDRATARSTMHEIWALPAEGIKADVHGYYDDELARIDGRWMFTSRRFNFLHRAITPIDG
jgi:hypothetical protein